MLQTLLIIAGIALLGYALFLYLRHRESEDDEVERENAVIADPEEIRRGRDLSDLPSVAGAMEQAIKGGGGGGQKLKAEAKQEMKQEQKPAPKLAINPPKPPGR